MQNIAAFADHAAMTGASEKTLETYTGHLERLYRYLDEQGYDTETSEGKCVITSEMLESFSLWLFKKKLTAETRNNYVAAFHKYFSYLAKLGRIDADPTPILQYAKTEYRAKKNQDIPYTDEQLVALLDALKSQRSMPGKRSVAFVFLALASALRVSELCSLKTQDIQQIKAGTVSVKLKGGSSEDIAIAPFALQPLHEYLAVRPHGVNTDALFVTERATPLGRQQAYDHISRAQLKAGIRTGVHSFRHTTVSRVNLVGGDAMSRDVACHSIKDVTGRYTHTTPEERRRAITYVFRNFLQMARIEHKIHDLGLEYEKK